MDQVELRAGTLELLGGRLCLDFANTADWHSSKDPVEFLTSYSELVAWSQQRGILTGCQAQSLLREAADRPLDAAAVLERAIALRETIYRIMSAISHGDTPPAADLTALNVELSTAMACSRIVPEAGGFVWDWAGGEHALDRMLWPVARDAAELLTAEELFRVGQCSDERCGWLFLDMSRNHTRRWCSMKDCGNRAKARRHYRRGLDLQERDL
jgi:predicted RNA-binding Zn ribbon-like protein